MIGSGVGFSKSTSEKLTSIFARFVLGALQENRKLVSKAARYSTTRVFGFVSSPKVTPLRLPYLRRSGAHLLLPSWRPSESSETGGIKRWMDTIDLRFWMKCGMSTMEGRDLPDLGATQPYRTVTEASMRRTTNRCPSPSRSGRKY